MSTELPAQFPPLEWLGYGLNLAFTDPFDFTSVYSHKTQVRVVDVTKDTKTYVVTINGVDYEIPKVVAASQDGSTMSTKRTFSDGTLAVKDLQNDAALAYRILPVTTSNISLFPLDKSLPTGNQFHFFVNDHDSYSGKLRDYFDFINEDELLKHVSILAPFDNENPEVVRAYIEFFKTVGSHTVVNTGFGARFQLEVWASSKYEEVNRNFNRDITASVRGLNDGGNFDKTVFGEEQYWNFSRISQRIFRIRGGDSGLVDALMESPDFPTFQKWTESISGNPVVVTLGTTELWTLLRNANNKILRASASDIEKAFEYFSSLRKPDDKHTWVIFEMESNWGEFGILTPSAIIGGSDSNQLAVRQRLSLGPPRVSWGSPNSLAQNFAAVVEIINDGTPIDIYLNSGTGTASVKISDQEYVSNGGTKWFYHVPVSP